MAKTDQLEIPNAAIDDPNSFELARIWIAKKNQYVSIRSGVWNDPAAWGLMLADLVRHVANMVEETQNVPFDEVVARVKLAFEAEFASPTNIPSGQMSSGGSGSSSGSGPLN